MIEFYGTVAFLALAFGIVILWAIRRDAHDAGQIEERLRLAEDMAAKTRREAEIHAAPARPKPELLAILRDHGE
ncbi:hypothetical protein [Planctomyces sp. SH-PL14]|uniref:hypothetical protein n=1 Tax=Planctomyces sp. SH-PL14 TaxID=1632864 RepID=UPI000946674D|nr:hypothetical protein [Planctomyces sp. SH-PL14]